MTDRAGAPAPDALLCALAIAPAVYSRNRFLELYRSAELSKARRRAARLRSLARQLVREGGRLLADGDGPATGPVELRLEVPSIGLRRTVRLEPLELALLRYLLHRAGAVDLAPEDRARVEAALGALSPLPAAEDEGSPSGA